MGRLFRFIVLGMVTVLVACSGSSDTRSEVAKLITAGQFDLVEKLLEKKILEVDQSEKEVLEVMQETISRIRKEFPYSRQEVKEKLAAYYPNLSDEQMNAWENSKQLEMRIIDGEKRYFKRAVSNFCRLNAEAKKLKEMKDGPIYDGVLDFQQKTIPEYFNSEPTPGKLFDKRRIKVNYTVRLKANAVPDGEMVSCWLPYPRTGSGRLPKVESLKASESVYLIAPKETLQRTIYMEKRSSQNNETVFAVSYVFTSAAQWFNTAQSQIKPYRKSSALYKNYTSENIPHIVLSEDIKQLAQEIVGDELNPVKQVKLLYYWLNDNIPWAGALEYSTIECIPEYVIENRRGDCGMQTLLFLSLARSLGIPCKWQSGWYLLPQEKNLHDWAEVYYEGIGWVPVDPSFKLIESDDVRIKEFYMNGLDSYRLIINDDYGQELYPPKKFYRSEPYDFQRGELEWQCGNLYFDTWSYKMEVEYLD